MNVFRTALALVLLGAPLASAQPAPSPPPPAPAPAPAPIPTPAPGPTPAPPPVDWLPGVTDLTSPDTPTGVVTLTLDHAVELALKTQPALRESRAQAEAAFGRVDSSRVIRHPTVNLNASVALGSTQPHPCASDPTMTCGGFFDPSTSTGLGASASYRITDFGLTKANIAAATATAEAAVAAIDTAVLDVRKNVESAYLEAVARERLTKVAAATVKSEAQHLDQAQRFVAAQAHDPIEVAQAQARFANAKSAFAQAQSQEAIALANLRAAIGYVELQQALVVDPNWPVPPAEDPPELKALVESAREHRPELVQLDRQLAAADLSVTAAHRERNPVLAATASTQWSPSQDDWTPQPTWNVGVTLSWALLDGGKSAADVRIANANLASTAAQRDGLLVQLTSDLDSARSQIVANRAAVDASNEAVTAALAQLKLADARYAQGLGSQIELADAQTAVTTAQGNLVQAEFALANAWAALRRSLGQS